MTTKTTEEPDKNSTIKIEYYSAYFGKDAEYYLPIMIDFEHGKKFKFNIWAFLCGMVWQIYRRLYKPLFIIFIMIIFLNIIQHSIVKYWSLSLDINKLISFFYTVICGLLYGFTGNYFLMRSAQHKTLQIMASNEDEVIILEKLEKAGSANQTGLIIIFFLIIVLIVSYFIKI